MKTSLLNSARITKGVGWRAVKSMLRISNSPVELRYKIVVGLGNPGKEYVNTRHNMGFWCVDRLAAEHAIILAQRHRHTVLGEGLVKNVPVVLAKPRTFVNNSGRAITSLLAAYRASASDLLVIYDDMDLPQGEIRLRSTGSSGGHNGIKSIIAVVGTQTFSRLRIGIGRPPMGKNETEHVLGTMCPQELEKTDEVVSDAVKAATCVLAEGIGVAMNRFN